MRSRVVVRVVRVQVNGTCQLEHVSPDFESPARHSHAPRGGGGGGDGDAAQGGKKNKKPVLPEQRFLWRSVASTQPGYDPYLHLHHLEGPPTVLKTNDVAIFASVRNCHAHALACWRKTLRDMGTFAAPPCCCGHRPNAATLPPSLAHPCASPFSRIYIYVCSHSNGKATKNRSTLG